MGKGSAPSPPPAATIPSDNTDAKLQEQMMQAMMMMSAGGGIPAAPAIPAMPAISKPLDIDWSEKTEQLSEKMKADYHLNQLRRHGMAQSVHTSPLVDEEEPDTTKSILTSE